MKKEVTFREYRDQDEKKIEKIIRKTWNYDKFCDDRVSKLLSEVFLFSCLCNQTYTGCRDEWRTSWSNYGKEYKKP